jgi:hypothetical protein
MGGLRQAALWWTAPGVRVSGPLHPSRSVSNERLLGWQDGQVSLRWKDYRHPEQQKVMTVSAEEFIRRFLLHALPPGCQVETVPPTAGRSADRPAAPSYRLAGFLCGPHRQEPKAVSPVWHRHDGPHSNPGTGSGSASHRDGCMHRIPPPLFRDKSAKPSTHFSTLDLRSTFKPQ